MDPETLVTFSFRAPHHVRTVELLGSWDNFSRPYTLYHDKRRGQGFWTGCFQFHDIVFDGFEVDYSRPRTGGLKQGGMYWYYFRLDDSMEAYDDSRACTADCPLMPGQMVNVIDVPREVTESPLTRCASADLIGTLSQQQSLHTMNPRAKYLPLDPPPVSKVHERCVSDLALGGRLERPKKTSSSASSSENEREMAPAKKMLGAVRRGLSLTGSLRTMASRAALRARVRLEATTYEASLVDESSECASIGPSRSMLESSSRPQTRRPLVETYQPTTGNRFQTFPQVVGIPTPSASPAKQHRLQDSDAASLGPQSICNVQFLSSSPEEQQQKQQPRHYSLSNPDSDQPTTTTHDPTLPTQTEQRSPSEFSISSPTFSDATISTTEGGEIATPSDVLTDEDDDAHMRWGHAMRNYDPYRLPDDEPVLFMSKVSKMIPAPSGPTSDAIRLSKLGEGEGRSIAEAVFSELGYLGDSIQ